VEVYELARTRIEVEPRRGYLHAVLRGECATPDDVLDLSGLAQRVMDRHDTRRLLVDGRALADHLPTDACSAVLHWLGEGQCRQLAWVVPVGADKSATELVVTRINMTGLSSSLPLRAFGAIIDAHRWLDARPAGERRQSSTMSAVRPDEVAAAVERSRTPPRAITFTSAPPERPPSSVPSRRMQSVIPPRNDKDGD
jgi:hypothetical protein